MKIVANCSVRFLLWPQTIIGRGFDGYSVSEGFERAAMPSLMAFNSDSSISALIFKFFMVFVPMVPGPWVAFYTRYSI